ncbi:MAG: transketolase [Clostridiales bacterium]|nr:transketolase [Clostridiales bacterium]
MKNLDKKTIEAIRLLSIDAINKANSGHPGLPMGTATMAFVLWKEFLKGTSKNSKWMNRDRFVLSAGHGSMLLYSLLHLFGYDVSIDDIKNFRQLGSKTPGHPEFGMTDGVETTTGPLGQGIANAVGMAIAEKRLEAEFGKDLMDHHTYVIVGDGDLMEGISSEASSLAGHLKLGKLIAMYDSNNITIDGKTDITFTEDVAKRYEAYDWQVIKVEDGNDYDEIVNAISEAKKELDKPSMIIVKTIIGYGSPNKAGTSSVHGSPLGKMEAGLVKKNIGWDGEEDFYIPEEVSEYMKSIVSEKEKCYENWLEKFENAKLNDSDLLDRWNYFFNFELPSEILEDEILWNQMTGTDATRNFGGKMINKISEFVPNLMGGSADLNGSTKTHLTNYGDFSSENPRGNNIFFGVREHAMAGILNGISLHGGFRVFGATFLSFADYMKPSIRLSALMNQPVVYVFTHDSIGVGEDGPTHQPIEQVLMLRSIPNLKVFRPADGKETAIAWVEALKNNGPSALILTRQNVPCQEGVTKAAHFGAYVLVKEKKDKPDIILMASGSEVQLAVETQKELENRGIDARVVSMMSWRHFEDQSDEYKEDVLPSDIEKRVSIEVLTTMGWHKYTGLKGLTIGLDRFGESGKSEDLFEHFGFTTEKVLEKVLNYLNK